MFYTTTSDPSDGWSNHWSNAPIEKSTCPVCGSENIEEDKDNDKFCIAQAFCNDCGNVWDL
jgi:transcription elongation factor Elf1